MGNVFRRCGRRAIAALGFATIIVACLPLSASEPSSKSGRGVGFASRDVAAPKKRVAVLSARKEPSENTSQGLYIRILREAGFEARAINAEEVRATKLAGFDIFIIGGGSGSAFNRSLGPEGGKVVREFIRNGGGALASCAGGYSFAIGRKEELKYISIAQAEVIDSEDGRWARGKGDVEIAPADDRYRTLTMFYANGPLWEIVQQHGADRTVALARFQSDVKKEGDPGGIMPGTPAILGGTFGDGRFVLFSGHPEFYKQLGNQPLVADAARWVTGGPLKSEELIRWAEVFSSSRKREQAEAKPVARQSGS